MDILNFISWIKGGRVVTTVDPTQTLLPVGLKDNRRDDGYLAGAISVQDLAAQLVPEPAYKVYTALLSQVGSSAPTAIVLENTLDNAVTLSRNSAGNYSVTCVDFNDTTKVYVELKNINTLLPQPSNQFFYFNVTSGVINIRSTQVNFNTLSFTPTDSILDKCPIEIRVYN